MGLTGMLAAILRARYWHRAVPSLSDDELLGILRETAAEIGHNPSKKDVFCVYRVFILRRFEKWPWALVAAGLKEPKQKPQRISRQNGKNQAGHIRETNGAAK